MLFSAIYFAAVFFFMSSLFCCFSLLPLAFQLLSVPLTNDIPAVVVLSVGVLIAAVIFVGVAFNMKSR
jgi:hypothetical protein